jgi:chromosome segregation ATPase
MAGDELIREIELKKHLSELDGSSVSDYDSSESMTEEELRSDNRFLIEQLKEAREENRKLKEDISEIKQDLKEANRRADEEQAERKKLFDRLVKFMDDQKSADDDKKKLEREIETLKNRLAVANQALYGGSKTCSDKYSGQKNEGINDGRDDFDGGKEQIS